MVMTFFASKVPQKFRYHMARGRECARNLVELAFIADPISE
jgi:hypothetical protein